MFIDAAPNNGRESYNRMDVPEFLSLKNWLNNGWLTEHRTSTQEITALLAVADRDLADCRASGLSSDWQLNIAHNAALQAATVALAVSGYRAVREAHHYRIIQALSLKRDKGFCCSWDGHQGKSQ